MIPNSLPLDRSPAQPTSKQQKTSNRGTKLKGRSLTVVISEALIENIFSFCDAESSAFLGAASTVTKRLYDTKRCINMRPEALIEGRKKECPLLQRLHFFFQSVSLVHQEPFWKKVRAKKATEEVLKRLNSIKYPSKLRFRLEAKSNELFRDLNDKVKQAIIHLEFAEGAVSPDDLGHISKCRNLTYLDVRSNSNLEGLDLRSFPDLQSLNLSKTSVADQDVVQLVAVNSLTKLDLSSCEHISGASLKIFRSFHDLRSLNLSKTSVADQDIAQLAAANSLTELDLSFCEQISGASLKILQNLRSLVALNMSYTHMLADPDSGQLMPLGLRCLNMQGTQLTDISCSMFLSKMVHLRTLNLNFTRITDASLVCLKPLVHLGSLELANTCITDEGLSQFLQSSKEQVLKTLQSLNLSHYGFMMEKTVGCLQRLPSLTSLAVRGSYSCGFGPLLQLKNIRQLNITQNRLSRNLLRGINSNLVDITHLSLSMIGIKPEELRYLSGMKKLQFLTVESLKSEKSAVRKSLKSFRASIVVKNL